MKTTKITKPTRYNGMVLVPKPDGTMDVVNPYTRQWANFPTQRYAKWSTTVLYNLHSRFDRNEEYPNLTGLRDLT